MSDSQYGFCKKRKPGFKSVGEFRMSHTNSNVLRFQIELCRSKNLFGIRNIYINTCIKEQEIVYMLDVICNAMSAMMLPSWLASDRIENDECFEEIELN